MIGVAFEANRSVTLFEHCTSHTALCCYAALTASFLCLHKEQSRAAGGQSGQRSERSGGPCTQAAFEPPVLAACAVVESLLNFLASDATCSIHPNACRHSLSRPAALLRASAPWVFRTIGILLASRQQGSFKCL